MQRFTDASGRTWGVDITVDAIRRVRSMCGIDLLHAVEGELIPKLVDDPVQLCDILAAVCEPQAKRDQITPEEFGRGLAGDAIDEACKALLQGLVDFFPRRRRELFQLAMEKMRVVEAKMLDLARMRIESADTEEIVQRHASSLRSSQAS